MIEKSPMVRQLLPQEAQRVERASFRSGVRYIAALVSDTKGGQPEARCGDTPLITCDWVPSVASIQNHARFRMGLGPKIPETGLLDLIQKQLIVLRERRAG